MVHPYCESVQKSDSLYGLCCELLRFAEAARLSEVEGQGSILTYGYISACASRIRITAEARRDMLARTQWEHASNEVWA